MDASYYFRHVQAFHCRMAAPWRSPNAWKGHELPPWLRSSKKYCSDSRTPGWPYLPSLGDTGRKAQCAIRFLTAPKAVCVDFSVPNILSKTHRGWKVSMKELARRLCRNICAGVLQTTNTGSPAKQNSHSGGVISVSQSLQDLPKFFLIGIDGFYFFRPRKDDERGVRPEAPGVADEFFQRRRCQIQIEILLKNVAQLIQFEPAHSEDARKRPVAAFQARREFREQYLLPTGFGIA